MTMIDGATCLATFTRDGTRPGETHARGGELSGWLDDDEADAILQRLVDDDGGDGFRAIVAAFVGGNVQTIAFPMGY